MNQIKLIKTLEDYLNKNIPNKIQILFFDERYSTKEATEKLKQTDKKNITKN